jgi:hypothetical protein
MQQGKAITYQKIVWQAVSDRRAVGPNMSSVLGGFSEPRGGRIRVPNSAYGSLRIDALFTREKLEVSSGLF